MLALHLVAKLHSDRVDLRSMNTAPTVWRLLRRRFPSVFAVKLMPDHLHMLTPPLEPGLARAALANVCGRIQAVVGLDAGAWRRVPEPHVITKLGELRRNIRYVFLNECRAGLARDPLQALWSTYREMFDAVIAPWVDLDAVVRALSIRSTRALAWIHQFVSGDPHVCVEGTPLPEPALLGPMASAPLADIARAAAAATRTSPMLIRKRTPTRKLFIWLARAAGWRQTTLLAEVCGVTPDAIRRIARAEDPRAVACAARCLGDPRLLERLPDPTPCLYPRPALARPLAA
jgi:hypothetical protein